MIERLIRKLEYRDTLSEEEKQALRSAVVQVRDVAKDADLICEGDRPTESRLVIEGFTCRYTYLPNGRRQIAAVHVPGDFVDLHSLILKRMDHSIAALSACKIAHVSHEALRGIVETLPHLTRVLWLSTLIDGSIYRERLVALGRRSTVGSLAHLLCEMYVRLQLVELTEGTNFKFPLTQGDLADVLGVSLVHTNRTVQDLRREDVITWNGRSVEILDWQQLQKLADFDPTYLQLEKLPR